MLIASTPPFARFGRFAIVAGAASACATLAVLPYSLALFPGMFARVPVPLPVFVAAQCIQALIVLTLLSWVGVRLAHAVGLRSPVLQAIAAGTTVGLLPRRTLLHAAIAGAATGIALILLDKFSMRFMPAVTLQAMPDVALWKRSLAALYGGVTEEILCRLFLMSLLVWLYARFSWRRSAIPSHGAMWFGIIGAAVVFGVLHLPAASTLWPLNTMVVGRTLVMNSLGGMVFGWLYWRRGLEHAMLAHFCADLALHGIGGV